MSRTTMWAGIAFLAISLPVATMTMKAYGDYMVAREVKLIRHVIATAPTPLTCQAAAINTRSAAIAEGVMYLGDDLIAEVVP